MKKVWKLFVIITIFALLSACGANKDTGESKVKEDSKTNMAQSKSSFDQLSKDKGADAKQNESKNDTPVTIETYENSFTFDKVPQRVVSLSFSETQLLVALGLGDKIVGIATAETGVADCLPEYRDELSKLKVISDSTPTLEVLLASNPDFVVGTVYSFTEYGVAPSADFVKNNIPYYALRGTYVEGANIEDTYKDIENLGKIFRVEDRAQELIKKLKEREKQYTKSQVDVKAKVFVFDSGNEKQATTVGKNCLEEKIVALAGGENIFNNLVDQSYVKVSWEDVALKNPDLIVIYDYSDGNSAGSLDEKIAQLKNNPALVDVRAVKNENFASVRLIEMFPGLQMFDAAQKIQDGIKKIK